MVFLVYSRVLHLELYFYYWRLSNLAHSWRYSPRGFVLMYFSIARNYTLLCCILYIGLDVIYCVSVLWHKKWHILGFKGYGGESWKNIQT